jgi:hypothetical protein
VTVLLQAQDGKRSRRCGRWHAEAGVQTVGDRKSYQAQIQLSRVARSWAGSRGSLPSLFEEGLQCAGVYGLEALP